MKMPTTHRRTFLRHTLHASLATCAGALTTPATLHAASPFHRPGKANLKLSLAAYSFRDYFKDATHAREQLAPSSQHIDLFQFIDFCADQGCQGAELTSYYFPNPIRNTLLLQLKRHAFTRGITISGTAVGNQFTDMPGPRREDQIEHVKAWIDHAATMGAPHVRVFAGNAPGKGSQREALNRCKEGLKACCDHAAEKGIFLGLENHGGIVAEADPLIEIVEGVDSPWLGINLDTGNFHTEDPYGDIAKCAPYAVNVQLKVEIAPRGSSKKPSDLARLVSILKDAHYQGFVALEYEAQEDPWKAIPRHIAKLKPLLNA
ncbi:MAG: sugar phosphate isomerase/epimerase [Verrucomicrobiota bacterium]|nr:sugar phosphate isomerase/epimerase [Verrucomicrobiota bacterium]